MSQVEPTLSPGELRRRSCAFLLDVVRPEDGTFPYSTSAPQGEYVHDFDHPAVIRYSINSLLGLQAVAERQPSEVDAEQVAGLLETFLKRRYSDVETPADLGLLLVLLGERAQPHPRTEEVLARLQRTVDLGNPGRLTMQDTSWMLWGACAAAQAGATGAAGIAAEIAKLMMVHFVASESGFPRHNLSRYRRDVVSFGALTYFLRSMYEFARMSGDERAARLVERGVLGVVQIQGAQGEWPWLISVARRVPLDFYPIFAVHQDSMSMLFLLPALERGLPVEGVIRRSYDWVLGRNELSTPMLESSPLFLAYRSIERTEHLARARRYLRTQRRSLSRSTDRHAAGAGVRLNTECRSYHPGWIAYAWAGQDELPDASAVPIDRVGG